MESASIRRAVDSAAQFVRETAATTVMAPAMIKPAMAKSSKSHEFSNGPPVHRRIEEEYVQEHISTGGIAIHDSLH